MAINNFIPTIWSEHLLNALGKQYIGVANCNRDYEGEILGKGSSVKICGLNPITIGTYTKNSDISQPQELSDQAYELTIDQAKYFNFQIDDVERVQSSPKLMDLAIRSATEAIAKDTDRYIYRLYQNEGGTMHTLTDVHNDALYTQMLFIRENFLNAGITNLSDIVLEVSPYVATELLRAKMDAVPTTETFENGCIGSIAGMKVFVSPDVEVTRDGQYVTSYCYMRSKRAIAFAEQFSEIEAYRPEKRFAEAVKGLHLYGAKIIYPDEFCVIQFQYDEAGERQ